MFFLSLIMIGCTEKRVLEDELKYVPGKENLNGPFYAYGIYYYQGEPFTGVAFQMYNESTLKQEGTYKDGKRDGVFKYYRSSGSLEEERTYKDGLLHGLFTKYDRSGKGNIWSQETYENGKVVESWYK